MSDLDVNAALSEALQKHWADSHGGASIGGGKVMQWDTSKVTLKLANIEYQDLGSRMITQPMVIREDTINNDGDVTITHTFNYSRETTDSYAWHITGGVKVTAGVTAKVGLPVIGEGEASASVELSVEGGSETTHSETVTWQDTVEVSVPPKTDVDVQATLSTGKVSDLPFKANLLAYGQVGAYLKFGTDPAILYWEWADLETGSFSHAPGQVPLSKTERQVVATGTCDLSVGFHVGIATKTIGGTKAATSGVEVTPVRS